MPPHLVLVSECVDGVGTVTLNRADKRNALSIRRRDAVNDTLDALGARNDVKVVVLTGGPGSRRPSPPSRRRCPG